MRAGQVVRMRVNPKDCMSAIDVLNAAGVNTAGMSFSAIVSLAFASMTEGLRQQNVIPNRDGFDYQEMMQPFLKTAQGAKLRVMDAIHRQGSEFAIAPVIAPSEHSEAGTAQPMAAEVITAEQRRARLLLSELNAKKELAESGNPNVTWMSDDQQEFERLCKIVYG